MKFFFFSFGSGSNYFLLVNMGTPSIYLHKVVTAARHTIYLWGPFVHFRFENARTYTNTRIKVKEICS